MILLDTNALLWVLGDNPRLGDGARDLIRAAASHYSAVSVVETSIKTAMGKLAVDGSVSNGAAAAGLRELPLTSEHAEAIVSFPELARHDPFDRMLLAQARTEGMRLLTSDRSLLAAAPELTIDARE